VSITQDGNPTPEPRELTRSQVEFMQKVVERESDRTEDLAPALHMSHNSVRTKFTRIEDRLNVRSRGSAILACIRRRIVNLPDLNAADLNRDDSEVNNDELVHLADSTVDSN
jgi:DNA-binding CsgD family transcriptional regulator